VASSNFADRSICVLVYLLSYLLTYSRAQRNQYDTAAAVDPAHDDAASRLMMSVIF